jgi:hypothetical protein
MKNILALFLIIALSAGFFPGCKKDKGEPPVLPPPESMIIDFSNFASVKKSQEQFVDQKGIENSSWEFAATVVVVWRLLITSTLAVPVASFKTAMNQIPVYLSEKHWQWSYNVPVGSATYKARLTGLTGAGDIKWKMYISKEGTGGFAEFLWFEGTSKPDGTGGQWILYESNLSQSAMLQVDWTKTGSAIGSIKYTLVKNDVFKTSYIESGLTSGSLNAYFNVHLYTGLKFSDTNVEWNTTTHNGRVKCSDYLLGQWYCWDANKVNIVCL